jgi:hypothetical protein
MTGDPDIILERNRPGGIMRFALPALVTLIAGAGAEALATPSPPDLSAFKQRCASAGDRLWGRSLCAPVVVVDPRTGAVATSRKAPGAPLPPLRGNTAIKWGGEDWIMVLDPLPADPAARAAMLFHEAWHVQQEALGLPLNMAVAGHLDDAPARYHLRLEWAALKEALGSTGARRRAHVSQALAFRQRRIRADPERAASERDHMRHEGLAAYTGTALSGAAKKLALAEIEAGPRKPSLSRSFGYVSGPAWGLLLDAMAPGWRSKLAGGADLADLMPAKPAAVLRADDYGGTLVLAEETLAGVQRAAGLRAAVDATAPQRALRLPLGKLNMSFDPNGVSAAPDGSSLYRTITLADHWGEIRIQGSHLRIAPDYKAAFAPWPISASDTLSLAPGWKVEERAGGGAAVVKQD